MINYNKQRPHKASSGPRDRQLRLKNEADSQVVQDLRSQLQALTDAIRQNREAGAGNPAPATATYGTMYSEDEFQTALYEQLQIELKNKYPGLEDIQKEMEELHQILQERDTTITELNSELVKTKALLEAKDEVISALKDKPINVKVSGVGGTISHDDLVESDPDRPSLDPVFIDPAETTDGLISHISVKPVDSGQNNDTVQDKLSKLKGLGLGKK